MTPDNSRRIKQLTSFTDSEKLEWKRRFLLFSFFLSIAFIIWMLNALSKNYTTEIRYPITYSKFPAQKILVSDLPQNLDLKVSAHGYAILSYKLTNRPVPINFQVSSYAMNSYVGDTTKFYLLTKYAREEVARQLPSELQLMEINPDSLVFQFARKVEKLLPVDPVIDFQIENDFTLIDGVVVEPESIMVIGPDIYLDTMKAVSTKKVVLGVLEKGYEGSLDLIVNKGFVYDVDKVDCRIGLEKITEIQVEVPVQVIGLPDSMRIQTFPQYIKVSGQVGLSDYERVVPGSFWVEVAFSEVAENKSRLQVQVTKSPDYLLNLNFYPQTVEYLLSFK